MSVVRRTPGASSASSTGNSDAGPHSTISAPNFDSRWTLLRATRLCAMSPTMPTVRPSSAPRCRRIVYRSSSACVGCWWRPSPPLMTGQSMLSAMMRGAPAYLWRTISRSQAIDDSVCAVSRSDSPLTVADADPLMLTPSADRRLAAISKLVRVRVDGSRNRLTIVRPRRVGSFLILRSLTSRNDSAVSSTSTISSGDRSWIARIDRPAITRPHRARPRPSRG